MVNRILLCLLLLGLAWPVMAEPTKADKAMFAQTKAKADKGDAEAQMAVASLYANGFGVSRDLSKAARYHRKAAEQGLARAQYQVGLDYLNGEGVKPDKEEAVQWLRRAADQGLASAQVDLGICYANGDGIPENSAEAARWFRQAAAQGSAYGQYELGQCYLEGTGVAKNITEGLNWTRQAAVQGFGPAEAALATCYEKGKGLPKDEVQAYKWYSLAAAQDDEHGGDIRVNLAKLESNLTQEQVAEAQRLAQEFKPGVGTNAAPVATETTAATAAADAGWVNVKAEDETAEVYADGAFVGNAPARLKLQPGSHVIEVKKAGYQTYRRELQVSAGSDLSLHASLARQ